MRAKAANLSNCAVLLSSRVLVPLYMHGAWINGCFECRCTASYRFDNKKAYNKMKSQIRFKTMILEQKRKPNLGITTFLKT